MFKLNGKTIRLDQDLTVGLDEEAITYPAASLADASTREALGIIEVPDEPRPDDRFYFVHDNGDGTFGKEPKPLEAIKALKAAEVAASRYNLEVGGITVGAVKVATDRQTQAMLSGALMVVTRNPAATIDWKGDNGFVTLDAATVGALADAVGNHVQACFTAERAKVEALDALQDFDAVMAFDATVTLPA